MDEPVKSEVNDIYQFLRSLHFVIFPNARPPSNSAAFLFFTLARIWNDLPDNIKAIENDAKCEVVHTKNESFVVAAYVLWSFLEIWLIYLFYCELCDLCSWRILKVYWNNFELLIYSNLLGLELKQIFATTYVSKMRTLRQIKSKDFVYKIVNKVL